MPARWFISRAFYGWLPFFRDLSRAGAKARISYGRFVGPAEAVPLLQILTRFSQVDVGGLANADDCRAVFAIA